MAYAATCGTSPIALCGSVAAFTVALADARNHVGRHGMLHGVSPGLTTGRRASPWRVQSWSHSTASPGYCFFVAIEPDCGDTASGGNCFRMAKRVCDDAG